MIKIAKNRRWCVIRRGCFFATLLQCCFYLSRVTPTICRISVAHVSVRLNVPSPRVVTLWSSCNEPSSNLHEKCHYRPHTKYGEGNVFTALCLSVLDAQPPPHCSMDAPPLDAPPCCSMDTPPWMHPPAAAWMHPPGCTLLLQHGCTSPQMHPLLQHGCTPWMHPRLQYGCTPYPPRRQTVDRWVVRILLECILVCYRNRSTQRYASCSC